MDLTIPGNVYVVANSGSIDRLQAELDPNRHPPLQCVRLSAAEPIPERVLAAARVLVVEIDPSDFASMRRVAQVRSARGDLPLIVAIPDANVALVRTLIRQGVSDVATLPFDPDELTTQLLDVAAQARQHEEQVADLAPLTVVVRSTGGCGATTVVTHLAAALANEDPHGKGVCLIDLDIQFGTVATVLGEKAQVTVVELLEAGDRLDASMMRSAAIDSKHGFAFLAAPEAITPLETVDNDQLLRLLNVARRQYGHVLIDLPANWTNWTLSAVLASTDVVLLTDLTIPGLRQAKRRLQLFESVGMDGASIRIVVNRVEKRLFRTIGVDEAKTALGHEILATLASEPEVLSSAQDQGLLAGEIHRKSRFVRDIATLARKLTGQD